MSNDTQIVALPDWEHPLVQAAYKILCSDDKPPEGEHWEGFVARRITAAAIALQAEQKDHPETNAENRWRKAANEWARSTGVVLLKDQKPLEIIRSLIEGDRSARPLSEPPKADHVADASKLVERPPNCGTGFCSCIECIMDEPPKAPEPVGEREELSPCACLKGALCSRSAVAACAAAARAQKGKA